MSCLERIFHRAVNPTNLAKILWSLESSFHSRIFIVTKNMILQSPDSHWGQRWRLSSIYLLPAYLFMHKSLSMCLTYSSRFWTSLFAFANFFICNQHLLRVSYLSHSHIVHCFPTPLEINCLQSEVDTLMTLFRKWFLINPYNSQTQISCYVSKKLLLITCEPIIHEVTNLWKTRHRFSLSYTRSTMYLKLRPTSLQFNPQSLQ